MRDEKTTPAKPGFCITRGKGFHITLENGWTVSVQFGAGNYCDNYSADISTEGHRTSGERGSATAEVAAWDAQGNWHDFSDGDEFRDTVKGYLTPAQVLAFLNEIAAKPAPSPTP